MNLLFTYFRKIVRVFESPLYNNSIFIMLTSVLIAVSGFIFWLIAARLFSEADIGTATAIISSMGMIIVLSRVGLDVSLIKFFPMSDKSEIFSTSTLFTTAFATILGIVFVGGVNAWVPDLIILQNEVGYSIVYILFLVANSLSSMCGISLIAIRGGASRFIQSIVLSSRILLIFPLISFGAFGLFSAVGISFLLAALIALMILYKNGIVPRFTINRSFLKNSFSFSAGNYFSGMLMTAPTQILPLLVFNILGPEQNAYFYITYTVFSSLLIIPNAISTSLFVEGSHGENLKKNIIRALAMTFFLLGPSAILILVFGETILGFFGTGYTEGIELLQLLIVSSFFVSIVLIYLSIMRVLNEVRAIATLSGVLFAFMMLLSYVLMLHSGLIGIGYAWLITYGVGAAIALLSYHKWCGKSGNTYWLNHSRSYSK